MLLFFFFIFFNDPAFFNKTLAIFIFYPVFFLLYCPVGLVATATSSFFFFPFSLFFFFCFSYALAAVHFLHSCCFLLSFLNTDL